MSTLYENIMALCESNGIKGGKMCADIGLSRGFLTDLKYGRKQSASADTVKRIADYFGVSSDVVLYGAEKESAQVDEDPDAELYGLVRRANEKEETREMLEQLLKRSDLRALLHASKNASPEQIDAVARMLMTMKGNNDDFD